MCMETAMYAVRALRCRLDTRRERLRTRDVTAGPIELSDHPVWVGEPPLPPRPVERSSDDLVAAGDTSPAKAYSTAT